jgi:hypothetical protein
MFDNQSNKKSLLGLCVKNMFDYSSCNKIMGC